MPKTEQEIKENINDQLFWDMQVVSSDVDVEVEGNKATLSGTVPSFAAKRAAELDAWSVWGITQVENNLAVEYPSTFTIPSDSEIASDIKDVLLWNPSIDSTKVEVEVDSGIVTLEGSVDSFWKKVLAEQIASDMVGVLNITNKLTVVPTEDFIDEDIAQDIADAIDRKAAVSVDNVDIRVEDGVATISGTVPSYTAWSAAYDSAKFTSGVLEVNDKLEIDYSM